jgi:hypothetical protein
LKIIPPSDPLAKLAELAQYICHFEQALQESDHAENGKVCYLVVLRADLNRMRREAAGTGASATDASK